RERPRSLADKLRLYFDATWPEAGDLTTLTVWAAGELLRTYAGNFNLYVRTRDLIKQEGIIFRHLLRLILLCGEFSQVCPVGIEPADWQAEMRDIADQLTASCRAVDPTSTDQVIQAAAAAPHVVKGEILKETTEEPAPVPAGPAFDAGIWE